MSHFVAAKTEIFTIRQSNYGKIMFSVASVCLSVCHGGGPMWLHWTWTCWNLFTWEPPDMFKPIHLAKRVVGLWLKGLLVSKEIPKQECIPVGCLPPVHWPTVSRGVQGHPPCHACPPAMQPPTTKAPSVKHVPPPCMPPCHACPPPCHACPPPCTPPPCTPPAMHAPSTMHATLPSMPPCQCTPLSHHTCPPWGGKYSDFCLHTNDIKHKQAIHGFS